MKYLLLTAALAAAPVSAEIPQVVEIQVPCFTDFTALGRMGEYYKEELVFTADSQFTIEGEVIKGKLQIYVDKNGGYTIGIYNGGGACVLNVGTEFKYTFEDGDMI